MREAGFFGDAEATLVGQLAADVEFALDAIEHDWRRVRAEEDLRALSASLERRVEERTVELTAANRELEAFSYSVSHDLRAPLRVIDGFSAALAEDYAAHLPPEADGYLHRVRMAAQRMDALIDDMLQLSRVTRAEVQVTDVDVSVLAAKVAATIQEDYEGTDVELRIAPDMVTQADEHLVRILLANLLDNAWKFCARGEHPLVEVGRDAGSSVAVFFVRDNGVGLDLAHADRLFTPFQRFHSASEYPGTGVGLATVQRIVHRHGGSIWVESAVGDGTTFFFTLAPARD